MANTEEKDERPPRAGALYATSQRHMIVMRVQAPRLM